MMVSKLQSNDILQDVFADKNEQEGEGRTWKSQSHQDLKKKP